MVLSWINQSLSPMLAQSILWIDRACDVWEDLRDLFSQNDIFCLAYLQEEIHSLKKGNLLVSDFFTKLKILWDEFLILHPILSCSCDPYCHCGVVELHVITNC